MALSTIGTTALSNDSVTADKVADNAITTDMISSGQVGVTDLADGSITNAKLSNSAAVASSKLDLSGVTQAITVTGHAVTATNNSGNAQFVVKRGNSNTTGNYGNVSFQSSAGYYVGAIHAVGVDNTNNKGELHFRTHDGSANQTDPYSLTTLALKLGHDGAATFSGSVDAGAGLRLATDGSNNAVVTALGQNKSMYFAGDDGGVGVNALVLDMANSGNATFNGSVGVGIAPSKKLTVFGTGAGNATVQIEGEGGADPYINFLANNTQHWSLGVDDSDSDKFKLSKHSALGTNDYLVVDVTGKVGIGIPSGDGTLHVHTATAGTVTASSQADDLVVENNAEGGMTIITPNDQSARIRFTSPATNTDVGGAHIFYRQNINKMQVGTAVSGGVLSLASGASNDTLVLTGNGYAGIGTANPARALHVFTSGQNQDGIIKVGGSAASLGLEISYDQNSATTTKIISNPTYNHASASMHIAVDGDANPNQIVLLGSGNVGIGVAPEATIKADINSGSITSPMRLRFSDDNNSNASANPFHFEYKAGLEIENFYSGAAPSANGTKVAKLQLTTVTSGGYSASGSVMLVAEGTGYDAGALVLTTGSNSSNLETERVRIGSYETTFNTHAQNVDFRIASDNNSKAFFLEADKDVISIGASYTNAAFVDKTHCGFQIGTPGLDNFGGHMFMSQTAVTNTWMDIVTTHDDGATGVFFTIHGVRTGDQNRSYVALVRFAYNHAFTVMTVSQQNVAIEYRANNNTLQYRFTSAGPYFVNLSVMTAG